ncbi:hypothetical protein H4R35_002909 [Dimargaris xerosporica]|nr:hypothetical protein H4R35_002909 [Dimargaris xerosporica]
MESPRSSHMVRSSPTTTLPPVSSSSASACSPAVPPVRHRSRSTVSPPRFASQLLENERVYLSHILWYTWAGLRDASAWPTCLIVVYGSHTIQRRVWKCVFLNGVLYALGTDALAPETHFLGLDILSAVITFCYNAFWLYPVYCVSFLLNSVWYQEIADRVYTMRGGEAVRHSITYSRMLQNLASEIYRILLFFTYIVWASAIYMIPYIGPMWINRNWSIEKRLDYIEGRWAYFLGFGLPCTLITFFSSQFISAGIFAFLFPMYIIMASIARPLPKRTESAHPSRLLPRRFPIFSLSKRINVFLLRQFQRYQYSTSPAPRHANASPVGNAHGRRNPIAVPDSEDEASSASATPPSPTPLEPIVISSRESSPVAPRVQVTNSNQNTSIHSAPPATTSITQLTSSFQKVMIAPPRAPKATSPSATSADSASSIAAANRLAHDYAHGQLIAPSKMGTKKWDKARYLSRAKPTIDLSSLRDALLSLPPEPVAKQSTEARKTTQRTESPPCMPSIAQDDQVEDQQAIHAALNEFTIDHLRDGPKAPTPPQMTVELMDYQQQGLHWLLNQERSNIRGGILSDEMGLGKTVQIISLLVASKYPQEPGSNKHVYTTPASTGPTLIVGPVAVVDQWVAEVKAKTRPGTLTVYKYHGTTKITASELQRYDVVVTTYPTVMSRWSAAGEDIENSPISRQGSDSLGLPYVANPRVSFMRVRWNRIVLDESHIIKNHKSKTARACMSLTARYRWCLSGTPIQNNFTELYSYTQFLQFTEYNLWPLPSDQATIATGLFAPKPKSKSKADHVLPHIHTILKKLMLRRTKALVFGVGKARSLPPKTTKLVRLYLSLPERNFYETMRGLTLADVNTYMNTSNQGYIHILALLTRLRQACGHPSLAVDFVAQHGVLDDCLFQSHAVAQWAPYIMGLPLALRKSLALQDPSIIACTFCRVPSAQLHLMGPCGHFHCSECPDERDALSCSDDDSHSDSLRDFPPTQCPTCNQAAKERWTGPSLKTTQFVLKYDPSLLSRHVSSDRIDLADSTASEAESSFDSADDDDDMLHSFLRPTTSIACPPKPPTAVPCDDSLDDDPLPPAFATASGPAEVSCSVVHPSFVSTKIAKLMDIVQTIRREHPHDRIIVFSYFVELLTRIGAQLRAQGIQSLVYNGSMSTRERQSTLADFESARPGPISSTHADTGLSGGAPVVLLMSTKAGNAGINLTTANHVVLMDMWWNPASDMQAIDRVHRVGQQKPVFVYRMLVNNTVEEQLYALQTAKLKNIQGTLEQNTLSTTKLTQGDLRFIFDITDD